MLVTWRSGASLSEAGVSLALVDHDGGGGLAVGPETHTDADLGIYSDGQCHLADWDADGDLDVIVCWALALIAENLDGTAFDFRGAFPMDTGDPIGIGSQGSIGAGAGDLDGDGYPDFASGQRVYFGAGDVADLYASPSPGTLARPLDWDGDGDIDFITSTGFAVVNDATGFLELGGELDAFPDEPPVNYVEANAISDLTGDGIEDMLVRTVQSCGPFCDTLLGMYLFRGEVDGTFTNMGLRSPPGVAIGSPSNAPRRQVDLDGDGDIDVFEVDGWWENAFGFFATRHDTQWDIPIRAADVDQDGDADVLAFSNQGSSSSLTLWRNSGGQFTPELLVSESGSGQLRREALLHDLDGDGDHDFVAGGSHGGGVVVVRENAGGVFLAATLLPTVDTAYQSVFADDLDGDGLADLLGLPASGNESTAMTWRNLGAATLQFDSPVLWLAQAIDGAADLDGDGDLDFYGRQQIRNRRYHGPTAGGARQYGLAKAGPSGKSPLVGAKGPFRAGEAGELRLRRGEGGGLGLLVVGVGEGQVFGAPAPGLVFLLETVFFVVPLTLPGASGVAGAGHADLPFAITPVLSGLSFTHQLFVVDGAGVGGSNGLEVHYGG